MADNFDVVIVGGGLAGMTAGMYAARYGLKTALVERMMGGASIINIDKIENFPGFPEGISGAELAPAVQEQAMNAGVEFIMGETSSIARSGDYRVVSGDAGEIRAKAVIVAVGSTLRHLGIPGEEEFFGRGVSQCATCDGPLHMRQIVGVVGGGDSAADEALVLTEYASRVMLFHRRERLRAHQALEDRVARHPKIEVVWNSTLQEVLGGEHGFRSAHPQHHHRLGKYGGAFRAVRLRRTGAGFTACLRSAQGRSRGAYSGERFDGNGCRRSVCRRRHPSEFIVPTGFRSGRRGHRRRRRIQIHRRQELGLNPDFPNWRIFGILNSIFGILTSGKS